MREKRQAYFSFLFPTWNVLTYFSSRSLPVPEDFGPRNDCEKEREERERREREERENNQSTPAFTGPGDEWKEGCFG